MQIPAWIFANTLPSQGGEQLTDDNGSEEEPNLLQSLLFDSNPSRALQE